MTGGSCLTEKRRKKFEDKITFAERYACICLKVDGRRDAVEDILPYIRSIIRRNIVGLYDEGFSYRVVYVFDELPDQKTVYVKVTFLADLRVTRKVVHDIKVFTKKYRREKEINPFEFGISIRVRERYREDNKVRSLERDTYA